MEILWFHKAIRRATGTYFEEVKGPEYSRLTRQHTPNWLDFLDARQALIETLEAIAQLAMVDAEAMQYGRV